jgi:hypothetical protein
MLRRFARCFRFLDLSVPLAAEWMIHFARERFPSMHEVLDEHREERDIWASTERPRGRRRPLAFGAIAAGALAFGFLAFAALAIGRLVIGSLAVGRGHARELHIGRLAIGDLRLGRISRR